ncbi:type II toxin-antitoxin system Phd/YefM family antitoxin [Pedobacter sp. GR22-6]|uniref:type II toxin-antitoxin system Phd/YefM family antitoxin n=1 Tax=Pedobacter sp. GR22-6 TaxID=3127957 RepID=UPI00307CD517
MKTLTVGEFKTHFAEVLEQVKAGIGFAVTYGRKKEIVGYFLPESLIEKPARKLGILEGKATVVFKDDFKMSEEDLIG